MVLRVLVRGAVLLLAMLALVAGPLTLVSPANAQTTPTPPANFCFLNNTSAAGMLVDVDEVPTCVPNTEIAQGGYCGEGLYFAGNSGPNAGMCVANNSTCSGGIYTEGVCGAPPAPPTPVDPTVPAGFTPDPNAGSIPPGAEMQPMCVNASPFIGGGMFVVTGAVLCYSGAGRDTGIYAYTDSDDGGTGWNPWDPQTWDSLMMRDLHATDDITAEGTISAFGGAQIYSANGRNGLQVNDNGVLMLATDGTGNVAGIDIKADKISTGVADGDGNVAGIDIEADKIVSAVTDGTSTASTITEADRISSGVTDGAGNIAGVDIEAGKIVSGATDGTSSASTTTEADKISSGVTDGAGNIAGLDIEAGKVVSGATDGASTASTTTEADGITSSVGDGTASSSVAVAADSVVNRSTSGASTAAMGVGPGVAVTQATDGTSVASIEVDGTTGVDVRGNVASGGPGVAINGAIGDASTARTGVLINGDGQGAQIAPLSGPADWADVQVSSKSFTQTNGLGTGVIVNDYGMTTRTGPDTSMVMIQGALDFATAGNSTMAGATQQVSGGTSTVMPGASSRYIITDPNGRMTVVEGPAQDASSSMYITNGNGITNGVTVTERSVAISGGGSNPTSLVFSDGGANFSNSATGAPVRVSGIADGTGPYDAANIRQLQSGIASVAALAGLPAPQAGKRNSFGFAFGQHGAGSALALGGQSAIGDSVAFKYGASVSHASGHIDATATVGLGVSW